MCKRSDFPMLSHKKRFLPTFQIHTPTAICPAASWQLCRPLQPLTCLLWVHSAFLLLAWRRLGASLSLASADFVLIWKETPRTFFCCRLSSLHAHVCLFLPVSWCPHSALNDVVQMTTFVSIRAFHGCWSGTYTNPIRRRSCRRVSVALRDCMRLVCFRLKKISLFVMKGKSQMSISHILMQLIPMQFIAFSWPITGKKYLYVKMIEFSIFSDDKDRCTA